MNETGKKIALGSGRRFYGSDWLHIDNARFHHTRQYDIFHLPVEDNYCELLYACHLIAYFDREEIKPLLKEWYRILKPGGILRIATPDWDAISSLDEPLLGPLYGRMESAGKLIYHKTIWTSMQLSTALIDAGFKEVDWYDHNNTEHASVDDHAAAYCHGQLISLNVEAIK